MRVRVNVFYATDFADLSPGGIRSFISAVGRRVPDGVTVTYVGMGPLGGDLPRQGDEYINLCEPPDRGSVNLAYGRALRRRDAAWPEAAAYVVHRAEHVLAFRGRTPTALMLHGGYANAWRARRGVFGLAYPLIESLAANRAAVTMASAPGHLAVTTRRLADVRPLPSTYDDATFRADPADVRPPFRSRVLLVGRLAPEKRFHLALQAVASTRTPEGTPLTVDVLGDGPERPRLQQLAARLGVEARFHGMVPAAQIAAHHRRADAVLLLTSRFEGFPVAALEAAAGGSAVVGLAAPGTSESLIQFGGVVAPTVTSMSSLLRAASAGEHEPDPAKVREDFGPQNVAARFWRFVLDASGAS